MRVVKATIGVAMLSVLLFAATAAFGQTSSSPAGGQVRVFVTPGNGARGKIMLTGAIGDWGKTLQINNSGKPDSNGNFVKLMLHKGTFLVNITALNKKINKAQPKFNQSTCSAATVASNPVAVSNGTRLYTGIKGKIRITVQFAFVGRTVNGKCSMKGKPAAQYQAITGSGRVSF